MRDDTGDKKALLDTHIHFVTDRESAEQFAQRCRDLGVSISRAYRDAMALWLKHASESKAVRAYVEERRARLSVYAGPVRNEKGRRS